MNMIYEIQDFNAPELDIYARLTENLSDASKLSAYTGEVKTDAYGRKVPKHANGSFNLKTHTSSAKLITDAAVELMERIADRSLTVRRINITANRVIKESDRKETQHEQLDLFTDYQEREEREQKEAETLEKERRRQQAVLDIRKRYGKNAIMRGMNLQEGATMRDRNNQIGGHKA